MLIFKGISVVLGLTDASLLAPLGYLLAPCGSLLVSFGSLLGAFGSLLAHFASLLALQHLPLATYKVNYGTHLDCIF